MLARMGAEPGKGHPEEVVPLKGKRYALTEHLLGSGVSGHVEGPAQGHLACEGRSRLKPRSDNPMTVL